MLEQEGAFRAEFIHVHFLRLLQGVLFSIGSAFLYYVNHFKLYSSFCASHSKAQKVLHPSKFSLKVYISFSQEMTFGDFFLHVNTPDPSRSIIHSPGITVFNLSLGTLYKYIVPGKFPIYYSCQPSANE